MDTTDLRIIEALQQNGRRTNAELAREIGVAPSTMLDRIRRLEERGVLRGYHADVDPESIGLPLQGFISVALVQHDADCIRSFEQSVTELSFVRACYHTTGRFDYLLQLAARDLKHWGELVKENIAAIPGIGRVETFLVLSEVKADCGWPIGDDTSEDI